ncbi:hypothetical protein J31TS4_18400 [Paenibacillus sp. J31TS4]|uniref:endonuclease/exonuclease/phosphatase family protein n=1 Tax=Paenibacillus sp. J31TS4 TaxID=2807195 RepID=UPI001B1FAB19|nr:endonuclease/exonuclease/phosphatase family protein [Paenibacillus sp. J31TS4]GIP38560.1 hypothetical protein J31TS4_18400 [Paenibacillus sp. J31TS4]
MVSLFKKRRLSFFTVCMMLVQSLLLALPAFGASNPPQTDTIKVMTYNMSVSTALPEIAGVLRQSGADVIGLQRVDNHYSSRSEFKDQAKELADLLGMYYAYGANLDSPSDVPGEPNKQYGNAILSKYPILSSQNRLLTKGREQRGLLSAEIDWNGKRFWFHNTHLAGISAETVIQIPEILQTVSGKTGYSAFVGSLNHLPGAPELAPLDNSFYDVRTGRLGGETTPSANPTSRTDYIYADRQLEVVSSEVIPYAKTTSRPFVAELKVADPGNTVRSLSFPNAPEFVEIGTSYHPLGLVVHHADRSTTPLTAGPVYTSSKPEVAVVNEEGAVRGISPGTAIIQAVYQGKIAEVRVTVVQRIPGSNSAAAQILVNGQPLANFDPAQRDYEASLPADTTAVPQVTATAQDPYASVTVTQAAGLPGLATVKVTAENGKTSSTYTVRLKRNLPGDDSVLPLRVMSYNIHHAVNNANVLDLPAIAQEIRSQNVDVVGLQEVDKYYSSRSDMKDQAKLLAEELGMYYAYGANLNRDPANEGDPRREYGTAILSKYPILYAENYFLESYGDEQRGLLEALIDVNGQPVYFYDTHLGLTTDQRQSQAREILAHFSKRTGPKILVGDFNASPASSEIQLLLGNGLTDSFRYMPNVYTFPSSGPTSRIDYIFYSQEIKQYDSYVVQTEASDHIPVVGQYALAKQPAPPADTTPPGEITNLAASVNGSAASVSWTNPADSDHLYSEIYLNGQLQGKTYKQKFQLADLAADTVYQVVVKTVDKAGNRSQGVSLLFTTSTAEAVSHEALVSVIGQLEALGEVKHSLKQQLVNTLETAKHHKDGDRADQAAKHYAKFLNNLTTAADKEISAVAKQLLLELAQTAAPGYTP